MPKTQTDMPEWEKMGMTEIEYWNYLADQSLREANYEYEKRKKKEFKFPKIWRSGRRIFSLLFQKSRKPQ